MFNCWVLKFEANCPFTSKILCQTVIFISKKVEELFYMVKTCWDTFYFTVLNTKSIWSKYLFLNMTSISTESFRKEGLLLKCAVSRTFYYHQRW